MTVTYYYSDQDYSDETVSAHDEMRLCALIEDGATPLTGLENHLLWSLQGVATPCTPKERALLKRAYELFDGNLPRIETGKAIKRAKLQLEIERYEYEEKIRNTDPEPANISSYHNQPDHEKLGDYYFDNNRMNEALKEAIKKINVDLNNKNKT